MYVTETKQDQGFTLIEILVVTAIILIIIAAVSSLFFSSLKGATKTTVINEAKQNGDYALSVMERMIRNARSIQNIITYCDGTNKTSLVINNPDGGATTFSCPSGSETQIASISGSITNYLTSDKVTVSSCYFSCNLGTAQPAVVKISFSISQRSPSPGVTLKPEELISINYSTSVVVRNTGF